MLRFNGFPENFIVTNPQFGNLYMIASVNSNNYHSLEAQVTMRPTHGIEHAVHVHVEQEPRHSIRRGQHVYESRGSTCGLRGRCPITRVHDFRTNGTFTLPIGPEKALWTTVPAFWPGVLENWQMGWIVNVNSGAPLSIAAQNMLYANGTADIVGPFDTKGKVNWQSGASSGTLFQRAAL